MNKYYVIIENYDGAYIEEFDHSNDLLDFVNDFNKERAEKKSHLGQKIIQVLVGKPVEFTEENVFYKRLNIVR